MAEQYPDVLGDVVDAKQRWEVDGIQYMLIMEPPAVAPGQVTTLSLYLQSVIDTATEFSITLDLPRRPVGFSVAEAQQKVVLQPAEVALLRIPLRVAPEVANGSYSIRLDLRGKAVGRPRRIRGQATKGRWPTMPIKDTVGLEVAPVVGLEYSSKMNARPVLKLMVSGKPVAAQDVDLTPTCTVLWNTQDLDNQIKATKEFGDRRIHIVKPLTRPVIFAALLNETRGRFAASGVELQLGEAIYIAKIMTRTVELFSSSDVLQDALYVPIFKRTLASGVPFDSSVWLLMKFGYDHVLNLAIALSFGLLEENRRGRIWPIEEQRAARQFITGQLANRDTVPLDLVYAPLILGGILVDKDVILEGEDTKASLAALMKAKTSRQAELMQEDDQIVVIFDQLLAAKTA